MVCALAFGDAVKDGLDIKAVVTSYELAWLCESLNIDVLELSDDVQIDWCFDGADEVHEGKNLLKGRGGAMHRERKVFDQRCFCLRREVSSTNRSNPKQAY